MDLNRVAIFVRIVEAGGVTAAAAKLKLPKSSVSRSLTQLEQELGMALLVRGHRQLNLSDAGRSFFEAASKGLAAVEEAKDGILDQHRTPSGVVRLALPNFGTHHFGAMIARFVRKYPAVEIEVTTTTHQADPIRDGFDLALTMGKLADSSLIVRPLGRGDSGIFASAGYLKKRGMPHSPADLAKHDCVLYRTTARKGKWALSRGKEAQSVTVSGPLRVDSLALLLATMLDDAGLGLLPVHLAGTDPSMQNLTRVLPDYVVAGEALQLVYPASRHTPQRVRLLCEHLVASSAGCPNDRGPNPA
ncbi:LysR family transcriptional regulator [Pendulispora rubella]|uniref:LysR family transcriptional regulator n=1 Tax=Pendulispora rubella TaxID=2741070 RepID=A0ABZ2KSD7_9BACT